MKKTQIIQTFFTFAIPAVLAGPINNVYFPRQASCVPNDCYQALNNDLVVASSTCSEVLTRAPPTVTVTQYDFAATQTDTETVYEATITTTVLPSNQGEQRRKSKRSIEEIEAACGDTPSDFRVACNCIIGAGFNASTTAPTTTTVHVTIDDIAVVATTTTATGTLTVTETCSPTGNIVVNEAFQSGQLAPWYPVPVGSNSEVGSYNIVEDRALSNSWPYLVFNASVFKTTRFSTYSKVNIAQDLKTCPGVDYILSFYYKFEGNAGPGSYLVTFIGGMKVTDINNGPSTWTRVVPIPFRATAFTTELRIDMVNAFYSHENLYLGLFDVSPA
ncbi:hypothetical protein TWF481_006723 [Arthrobotrys musiformis]|uniref:CBM-cenC domain-containing protein n=1 Tax=Arthrobotrys musiformis TaxID=47236 RepID=A0AAV9W9C9_9PEZI